VTGRPKVLILTLTGRERDSWINPFLFRNLRDLMGDTRFDVTCETLINAWPVSHARNRTFELARQWGADVLVTVDNDQSFSGPTPLDVLSEMGPDRDFCAMVTYRRGDGPVDFEPIVQNPSGTAQGAFREVRRISAGCLIVSKTIWERIPGPWFRWEFNEDETGSTRASEDFAFCDLLREHGIRVWAHTAQGFSHWKTVDQAAVGDYIASLHRRIAELEARR